MYRTIVADPPWPYKSPGAGPLQSSPSNRPMSWDKPLSGVGSEVRYGKLSIEKICALPVPADANSHLYLWTTNAFLVEAHSVAASWGFRVVTNITWTKVKPDGAPSMKIGYYYRGATEHCLFGVRGSLRLRGEIPRSTALLLPRLPHSAKPAEFYAMVEEQSHPPYLELFARSKRVGWHSWGNECPNDVELVA
jgi:N6-adenosine-specific RNA methylase IME4